MTGTLHRSWARAGIYLQSREDDKTVEDHRKVGPQLKAVSPSLFGKSFLRLLIRI